MSTTSLPLRDHDIGCDARIDLVEDRVDGLTTKLEIVVEAIRGDVKLLLDRLDGLSGELRREIATVRKEHWSDHRVVVSMLKDHGRRLEALERQLERLRAQSCRQDDE